MITPALTPPMHNQIIIENHYDTTKQQYAIINTVRDVFFQHYRDPAFLQRVRESQPFNHTTDTPEVVANNIEQDTSTIKVGVFKPLWIFSRCIASTDIGTKTISFNKYKLSGTNTAERVNTLIHEYMHTLGYTHDGNYNTAYNRGTVPYRIGDMFVTYLQDNDFI